MPYSNKHPVSCPHIALNYSVWFAILAAWLLIIVECGSIADGLFVLTCMHVCACVRVCALVHPCVYSCRRRQDLRKECVEMFLRKRMSRLNGNGPLVLTVSVPCILE